MPCYYPIDGWLSNRPNDNGNYYFTTDRKLAQPDNEMSVPCGRCIGCRLQKSRDWSIRCMHETTMHDQNCFITLTYNDEHLPRSGSISVDHWQKFMKKLRFYFNEKKIRYYACAEYGTDDDPYSPNELGRPHYHAILFGHSFIPNPGEAIPGTEIYTKTDHGNIWQSKELEIIWGKGFVTVAEVSLETAAYVARYTCKKIGGEQAEEHYKHIELETGEEYSILPEQSFSSINPAIGVGWAERWETDLEKGFITVNGIKMPLPKAYDKYMLQNDNPIYHRTKEKSKQENDSLDPEKGMDRLRVKEQVKLKRIKSLKRSFK